MHSIIMMYILIYTISKTCYPETGSLVLFVDVILRERALRAEVLVEADWNLFGRLHQPETRS